MLATSPPAIGEAALGWGFGCSRAGALHRRSGRPCQDAHAIWTAAGAGGGSIALAVADGHGDHRHDLSHLGSMLAVRAAMEELSALHMCLASEGDRAQLKSRFKADFPRRLVRRWRETVLTEHLRRGDTSNPESEEDVRIRYGTTLLAALAVGDILLIGQIGDGGVLLVREGSEVECPLPNNPLEVGGETDSLGSSDAPRLWRTAAMERNGGDLLLLATDGLTNAFPDEDQWRAFALSLQVRIREFGWPDVASALPAWLDHYSEMATGDDITLAVAVLEPRRVGSGSPGSCRAIESEDWSLSRRMVDVAGDRAEGVRGDEQGPVRGQEEAG